MRRGWMLLGAGLVLLTVAWWWLRSTPPAARTRTLTWDHPGKVSYFDVDLDGQVRQVWAPTTGAPRVPICVPLGRPVTIRVRACAAGCSAWTTTRLELATTDLDGEPCTP